VRPVMQRGRVRGGRSPPPRTERSFDRKKNKGKKPGMEWKIWFLVVICVVVITPPEGSVDRTREGLTDPSRPVLLYIIQLYLLKSAFTRRPPPDDVQKKGGRRRRKYREGCAEESTPGTRRYGPAVTRPLRGEIPDRRLVGHPRPPRETFPRRSTSPTDVPSDRPPGRIQTRKSVRLSGRIVPHGGTGRSSWGGGVRNVHEGATGLRSRSTAFRNGVPPVFPLVWTGSLVDGKFWLVRDTLMETLGPPKGYQTINTIRMV
jgi:hypothetical protein